MNERQKQTEFLKQCLLYQDTAESHNLAQKMTHIEQDERRTRRALLLMVGLAGLAVVGLCYSAIFLEYFPQNLLGFTAHFVTQVFCVLGLVSVLCALAFAFLWTVYRQELDKRREQCRQLVTRLMESRLGKPVATAAQDNPAREGAGRNVHAVNQVSVAPAKLESTA